MSEAELALYQAENAAKASRALLSAAIGDDKDSVFTVADVPLPGRLTATRKAWCMRRCRTVRTWRSAKLNQSAAERFAEAEKKLRYPSISAVGVVGVDSRSPERLSEPIQRRRTEYLDSVSQWRLICRAPRRSRIIALVELKRKPKRSPCRSRRACASAWIEADNAWRRLDVTARLVDQATTTLRLAKARYEIGLSGILELTQAQLSQTSAQIAAANAKYDYLTRMANLKYAIGAFR